MVSELVQPTAACPGEVDLGWQRSLWQRLCVLSLIFSRHLVSRSRPAPWLCGHAHGELVYTSDSQVYSGRSDGKVVDS